MAKPGKKITRAIRESIDSSPDGLCFATQDGMPVLVNRQMNEIVERLLRHTVIDASAVWDALKNAELPDGSLRLNEPWLYVDAQESKDADQIIFELGDGSIWRFWRRVLKDMQPPMIQITAVDMTELFLLSRELYTNNQRIKAMQEQQKKLLADIVRMNQEKELLAAKVRIHNELGQCLVGTKEFLADKDSQADAALLRRLWEDTIRDLSNIPFSGHAQNFDAQAELFQVAQMIGCRINLRGSVPKDGGAKKLLNIAIREALTNAVRHAGADTLTVDLEKVGGYCKARITNNGAPVTEPIIEGGGLCNLRRSLEQEGAKLDISCDGAVTLTVTIPLKNEDD